MNPGKQRILVVDDEPDMTDLLAHHLRTKNWLVETLNDSTQILGTFRKLLPNLMILDVTMPGINGLQICRLLKADSSFRMTPIVLLSARVEENDRILGLKTGADDYICKPFSPAELLLRVERLLKERKADDTSGKCVTTGPISLDEDRHEVRVNQQLVSLTLTEFRLLRALMERNGRVQTREQLLTDAWDHDSDMETRTVDTHMRRLRQKLGPAASFIETVRGMGYRLTVAHGNQPPKRAHKLRIPADVTVRSR